jgi:hypothetical protein
MIQLTRKNKLVPAVVALLISLSAAGMSLATAREATGHPAATALAVIPAATRWQRYRRHAAARLMRRRLVRRLRNHEAWIRGRGLNLRPWLLVREWYARGPPR